MAVPYSHGLSQASYVCGSNHISGQCISELCAIWYWGGILSRCFRVILPVVIPPLTHTLLSLLLNYGFRPPCCHSLSLYHASLVARCLIDMQFKRTPHSLFEDVWKLSASGEQVWRDFDIDRNQQFEWAPCTARRGVQALVLCPCILPVALLHNHGWRVWITACTADLRKVSSACSVLTWLLVQLHASPRNWLIHLFLGRPRLLHPVGLYDNTSWKMSMIYTCRNVKPRRGTSEDAGAPLYDSKSCAGGSLSKW